MLVLKMVLLLSCHGAQLMANVDAISPNGLEMTESEFSPNAEDMHGLQSFFSSQNWQMYTKSNYCPSPSILFIDLNRWFDRVDLVDEVLRQLLVCSHHTLLFRLI